jgi:hypothetical protein
MVAVLISRHLRGIRSHVPRHVDRLVLTDLCAAVCQTAFSDRRSRQRFYGPAFHGAGAGPPAAHRFSKV